MVRDITFGQYVNGDSFMHRLDARTKLFAVTAFIVMLFAAKTYEGLAACAALMVFMYIIARIPLRMIFKSLKPILPIILITAALNMLFLDGEILWEWKFLHISREGIIFAVLLSARIICLIAGSTLLTYTTSPIQLTDGLEQIMKPLAKLRFPAHELSMMMTIALRFIPTLIEETDRIMSAQKARGAGLDTGKFGERIRALIPILVPLFVSAFRRADDLALAMECRCYRGGEGRTKLNTPKMKARDWLSMLFIAVLVAGIFVANKYLVQVV